MARRERSAASRSSSSSRTARSAGPRVRSDGKVDVYCPQCGAHFRLAETALESKVTCTECTRMFFAKTTAGKRTKGQDYSKVYVGLGVGAVVVIGTLILINSSGGKPAPVVATAAPNAESQLDIDRRTRQDQVMRWARAISETNMVLLRDYSDMAALTRQLGVDAQLGGDQQETAILAALKTNETTRLFYEMEAASAVLSVDALKAGAGPAVIYMNTRPGISYYDPKAGAQITVQWRMDGTQMKVADFAVTGKPIVRGKRPGDESKYFKPSEEIARPKQVEIDLNGRKKAVNESEPVAIAHLKDTPPDVQQRIDQLVADLIRSADPDAPGKLFNSSTQKLKELGRPAVARLMNALHDLYPDVNGNNQKLSQVTRALLDITGQTWAYDVAGTGDAQKDKAARESVIKQWFAWWWRYANDDFQYGIDQGEDLLAPKTADPKAGTKK